MKKTGRSALPEESWREVCSTNSVERRDAVGQCGHYKHTALSRDTTLTSCCQRLEESPVRWEIVTGYYLRENLADHTDFWVHPGALAGAGFPSNPTMEKHISFFSSAYKGTWWPARRKCHFNTSRGCGSSHACVTREFYQTSKCATDFRSALVCCRGLEVHSELWGVLIFQSYHRLMGGKIGGNQRQLALKTSLFSEVRCTFAGLKVDPLYPVT